MKTRARVVGPERPPAIALRSSEGSIPFRASISRMLDLYPPLSAALSCRGDDHFAPAEQARVD
jgi:hypothetical protein